MKRKKHTTLIRILIWCTFFIIDCFVINIYTQAFLNILVGYLIMLLLCYLLYADTYKHIIFYSLTIYILGMLSEFGIVLIFQMFNYPISNYVFPISIVSKLLLFTIIQFIINVNHSTISSNPAIFPWFLLILELISNIFIIYTFFIFNTYYQSILTQTLTTFSLAVIFILNLSSFIIYKKLSMATEITLKNTALEHQIQYYTKLLNEIRSQQQAYATERHNIKNQLLAIQNYAINKQYDSIFNFIKTLLNNTDFGLVSSSYCSNIILDALLRSKNALAEDHNIKYQVNVNVPKILPFDDIDLCLLIGNALDNAFDAALNYPESAFVYIYIYYHNNVFHCIIKNSYSHKLVLNKTNLFQSSKSNPSIHGYGLYSIKNVITKYSGNYLIDTTDDIFSLNLLLYTI